MLPRSGRRFAHVQAGGETFGHPLQLEQSAGILRKKRRHQMLPLVRAMNLMPGFEQAELIEVFRVLHDVAMDARQQRRAQQLLTGRNRIHHANVILNRKSETARFFFADERIVRYFRVTPRSHHALYATKEFALGWVEGWQIGRASRREREEI